MQLDERSFAKSREEGWDIEVLIYQSVAFKWEQHSLTPSAYTPFTKFVGDYQ